MRNSLGNLFSVLKSRFILTVLFTPPHKRKLP